MSPFCPEAQRGQVSELYDPNSFHDFKDTWGSLRSQVREKQEVGSGSGDFQA